MKSITKIVQLKVSIFFLKKKPLKLTINSTVSSKDKSSTNLYTIPTFCFSQSKTYKVKKIVIKPIKKFNKEP